MSVSPYAAGQVPPYRKGASCFLAFVWILGLLCGAALFLHADSSFFLWMRRLSFAPVSIVNLLFAALTPLMITIAAAYLRIWFLFYPVCFWRALQVCYISCMMIGSFGSAGWLVCLLFLFHNVLTVPMLYFYWLRCLGTRNRFSLLFPGFLLSTFVLISSVEIRFIAPILASLMEKTP